MPYMPPNPASVHYIIIAPPDVRAVCEGAARVHGTPVAWEKRTDVLSALRTKVCTLAHGCACTLVSEHWWQTMQDGGGRALVLLALMSRR